MYLELAIIQRLLIPFGPHKEFAHDKKYIKVASSYICICFFML